MKRLISLLLALLLCFSLAACAPLGLPEDTQSGPDLEIVTQAKDPIAPESTAAPSANPETQAAPADTQAAPAETQAAPAETQAAPAETQAETEAGEQLLDEDGWYNTKDEVALYIHQYGKLPGNYITKKEAEALGWPGGSLEPYAPGKSIGGGYFGNYEGLLPTAKGRKYTECDIDTAGKNSRGAKRIVFSNDGLIYYTGDHYESFELLYGEP